MWQPIETSPKGRPLFSEDGPRVLLGWSGSDHMVIGSYRAYGKLGAVWRDGYGGPIMEPTHWMPLPQPPPPETDED